MRMRTLLSSVLTLFISVQAFAKDMHVYSDRRSESRFIRVTDFGESVSFSFCDQQTRACEQIGERKIYLKSTLSRKGRIELARAGAVGALDLGATIIVAAGSAWAAGTVLAANSGMGTLGVSIIGGGAVGATATQVLVWSVKKLNPRTYLRASAIARNSVVGHDKSVADIVDYRDRLETLLAEIE
ncbi:MAG: hypothetical protein EOP05_01870 [Proteobacteria bacterium]|nr:MAG: hypothetical protein EOP05_01870 [Pseudomonadota bacterium]